QIEIVGSCASDLHTHYSWLPYATQRGWLGVTDFPSRHPIFWVKDPSHSTVIPASAALTLAYVRFRKPPLAALEVADAFGLSVFTNSGAQQAEAKGLPWPTVVGLGTVTGSAVGVLRDVLSGEVPLLFRQTEEVYATAATAGVAS